MYRHCPRCGYELEPERHGTVELDRCPRCQGLYFDAGEFAQTPQSANLGAQAYAQHWLGSGLAQDRGLARAQCPDRHGAMHSYIAQNGGKQAALNICDHCGGLWFDKGQAMKMRELVDADNRQRRQAQNDAGGLKTYLFQLFTGMPIEVYNPVRRKPVMMFNTIALLFITFAAQIFLGEKFTRLFALTPVLVASQPWTVLSAALLHGGLLHLLGNLYFFYIFGDNVEDRLGRARFLWLMLASALAGSLLYLLAHLGSQIPELGFSAVVAGIMAAYLLLFPKVKLWIVLFFVRFKISAYWYIGAWIALQFLAVFLGAVSNVAYTAHIGGFMAGAALAWAWKKRSA